MNNTVYLMKSSGSVVLGRAHPVRLCALNKKKTKGRGGEGALMVASCVQIRGVGSVGYGALGGVGLDRVDPLVVLCNACMRRRAIAARIGRSSSRVTKIGLQQFNLLCHKSQSMQQNSLFLSQKFCSFWLLC
jgi:hypothetical protein